MRLPVFFACVLLVGAGSTAGCSAKGSADAGCRSLAALAQANPVAPKLPRPKKAQSKPICTPATSKQWQKLKPFRGKTKTNGKSGRDCRLYQWDYTHGDIEVYDCKGKHLGSMDPQSGKMTKPADPGRTLGGAP